MSTTDKADAVTAARQDFDNSMRAAQANDPEFQRLQKAWLASKEDGSYSSPEFLAMDARREQLEQQVTGA